MTSLSARTVAAIVALRVRHEDTVDALRRRRAQEVREGRRRFVAQRATLLEENLEKVVLQKDHLNVVGNHGTQAPGASEVEVTRDADGGMRLWATCGGGGGGGNLQWAGSWGGTIPDGIFLSQYQGAWS
jgi:hypothetical protein